MTGHSWGTVRNSGLGLGISLREAISEHMVPLNRAQRIAVWAFLTLFVAILLFPPWWKISPTDLNGPGESAGWAFILCPPSARPHCFIDPLGVSMEVVTATLTAAVVIARLKSPISRDTCD